MSGFLLQQTSPGAATCILVGPWNADCRADLSRVRALLWLVHNPAAPAPPVEARRIEIVAPDADAPEEAEAVLERFLLRDPRRLPHLFVTHGVAHEASEDYQVAISSVHRVCARHGRLREARQMDGFITQKHVLLNLPAALTHPLPASWSGAFSGLPAFVCAGGSSLAPVLAPLAGMLEHGVVCAADTALRDLARHGVRADFAINSDPRRAPGPCLAGDMDPAWFVLASTSAPSWRRAVSLERLAFVSTRQITERWLVARGMARTPVSAAEHAAATALELARFLGCRPILLLGFERMGGEPALPDGAGAQRPRWHEILNTVEARLEAWPAGLAIRIASGDSEPAGLPAIAPEQLVLPPAHRSKRARLSRLAPAESPVPAGAARALSELGTGGTRGCRTVPVLRAIFAEEGIRAGVAGLRRLLAEPVFASAMGAFAEKLLPHLGDDPVSDRAFWSMQLDELEELSSIAESLYEAPLAGRAD